MKNAVNFATVDKYGETPVLSNDGGIEVEVKVILAEYQYDLLLKTINGAVDADSGDSVAIGTPAGFELSGGVLTLHPQAITGASQDTTVWKAVIMGTSKFPFKIDSETVYEVTFMGVADTSKADGNMLGQFGTPAA